jgi:hypothetical protein
LRLCAFAPLREKIFSVEILFVQSPFVPREATISRFATNPTRTFFANALKADRNHRFIRSISFNDLQEFHFMPDKFHLMPEPTRIEAARCFSGQLA